MATGIAWLGRKSPGKQSVPKSLVRRDICHLIPIQVLASCGVDGTVRLWDIRDTKAPEKLKWQADVVDINVISWNTSLLRVA